MPPLMLLSKAVLILLLTLLAAPTAVLSQSAAATPPKAEACAACHGANGISTNPAVPSIAGQVKIYLHWQLILYRDKRRVDPQMAPIAAGLSDADMADLAAWFAAQKPAAATSGGAARVESGQRLAQAYHCNECHGPDYSGRDYAPRLRGLSREYLTAQMRAFKARTRGDLDGAMTQAAQPVADADIEPLMEYIARLP